MKGVVSAPPVFHFNIWQLYFNIDLENFNPRSATYILLLGNGRQVWFSSLSWMSWCSRCVHYIINFKSFANYKENSCKYLECTLAFHYASTHWTPIKTLDLFLLCFKCQLAFCCCVEKYFRLFCPFSCPAKLSCACWLPPSIFQLITGKLCFASGLSIFCAAISSTASLTKKYYIIIHNKTRQSLVYIFNLINSHKNFVLLACLFIYSYLFCGWAFNLITTEV